MTVFAAEIVRVMHQTPKAIFFGRSTRKEKECYIALSVQLRLQILLKHLFQAAHILCRALSLTDRASHSYTTVMHTIYSRHLVRTVAYYKQRRLLHRVWVGGLSRRTPCVTFATCCIIRWWRSRKQTADCCCKSFTQVCCVIGIRTASRRLTEGCSTRLS